jgi:hypothetical protein
MVIPRNQQFDGCLIGEFDQAVFVYRHNGRWARFDQCFETGLRFQTQAPVADQLPDKQPTADQGERFKRQANKRWGQRTEHLGQPCTANAEQSHCPPWQISSRKHNREQVEEAQRHVRLRPPVHHGDYHHNCGADREYRCSIALVPETFQYQHEIGRSMIIPRLSPSGEPIKRLAVRSSPCTPTASKRRGHSSRLNSKVRNQGIGRAIGRSARRSVRGIRQPGSNLVWAEKCRLLMPP